MTWNKKKSALAHLSIVRRSSVACVTRPSPRPGRLNKNDLMDLQMRQCLEVSLKKDPALVTISEACTKALEEHHMGIFRESRISIVIEIDR